MTITFGSPTANEILANDKKKAGNICPGCESTLTSDDDGLAYCDRCKFLVQMEKRQ